MNCTACNYPSSRVIETRQDGFSEHIRRRRECIKCGARYTTIEHVRDTVNKAPYKTPPPRKVLEK